MGQARAVREHYGITVNYPGWGGLLGLCGTSNVAQPPVVEVISWCNEEREKGEKRWTAEGCTVSIIILQGFGRTMHC